MAPEAEWRILTSTMLRAVSYDPRSRELRVRFHSGSIYRYHDVPQAVADHFLDPGARSHGRYFNENVRDAFEYDEERPSS